MCVFNTRQTLLLNAFFSGGASESNYVIATNLNIGKRRGKIITTC